MSTDQNGYGGVPGWWSSYVLQDKHHVSTGQLGYGGVPRCCVDPAWGYQILSSYFYVSQVSRQTYMETIQPRRHSHKCTWQTQHARPGRCDKSDITNWSMNNHKLTTPPRALLTKRWAQDLGPVEWRCRHVVPPGRVHTTKMLES